MTVKPLSRARYSWVRMIAGKNLERNFKDLINHEAVETQTSGYPDEVEEA